MAAQYKGEKMKYYGAIREKIIRCERRGKKARYIEVDIGPEYDPFPKRNSRERTGKISEPKQKLLNDKNAIRYLYQLIKANFNENDLRLDLTYKNKYLPKSEKDAVTAIRNYLQRVDRQRAKAGLSKAKYIVITEYGKKHRRIHHHVLISGGLDRDMMESLWCDRKRRGKDERESLGYANCDRLQFESEGIKGLMIYITKDMKPDIAEGQMTIEDLTKTQTKGKRRWMQSQGLIKPWYSIPQRRRYTKRKLEQLVKVPADSEYIRSYFRSKYPGYELDSCRYEYNEFVGEWSIYIQMHLIRSG